jgi:hypothetical protein
MDSAGVTPLLLWLQAVRYLVLCAGNLDSEALVKKVSILTFLEVLLFAGWDREEAEAADLLIV